MGRVRRQPLRAGVACAAALATVSACGSGVPTSAVPASAARAASPASPGGMVFKVLEGNGIDGAGFGQARGAVTSRLDRLVGPPTRPYSPSGACQVDHVIEWSGLYVFFRKGRFIGYTYGPPQLTGQAVLATARGLRVGDTLGYGQRLYGQAFHMGVEQGGVWWVTTTRGQIDGFANGPAQNGTDVGPRSHVMTIEAGDVGCPAMTP
jgi:hypothetical protein